MVVQTGVGTPFPPHYTPEKAQQLDQVCHDEGCKSAFLTQSQF